MTDLEPRQPKPPLHLDASLESRHMGESPLLVASGPLYPSGITYKEYVPSTGEDLESVTGTIKELSAKYGVVAVSAFEGVPVVALPESTKDPVQASWQILKLLSSAQAVIEEIEPAPEKSSEELRGEIGAECLRVFGRSLEWWFRDRHKRLNPKAPPLAIDWNKQRTVQVFHIAGQAVPGWLRGVGINMSTDGALIKLSLRDRLAFDHEQEGPIRVGGSGNGTADLQLIDEPLVFGREYNNPGEATEQHYERLAASGFAYQDLEEHRLAELLQVMKHLQPDPPC